MVKKESGLFSYIAQKATAVVLLPCYAWLVFFIVKLSRSTSLAQVQDMIASPLSFSLSITLVIVSLLHGFLGVKEVIEDYVHSEPKKKFIVQSLVALVALSVVAAVSSMIYFYVMIHLFSFC